DFKGVENQPLKTLEAVQNPDASYRYTFNQQKFINIPGNPIAYWVNDNYYNAYKKGVLLKDIADVKKGLTTGNTEKFIKFWFEVSIQNFSLNQQKNKKSWFPCHKGGGYRKWYGNFEKVIFWENDGYKIRNYRNTSGNIASVLRNLKYMFNKGIVFSKITSAGSSCRIMLGNEMFDDAVQGIFVKNKNISIEYLLSLLNSPIIAKFLEVINPTLNKQINDLERIPILVPNDLTLINSKLTTLLNRHKTDWDSFEISWDFKRHPFLTHKGETVEQSFHNWEQFAEKQFYELKENEEKLNEIFIDIYGLEDELTPDVAEEDVSVRKADLERDVKSFISYAVGCMFGRYSLDE